VKEIAIPPLAADRFESIVPKACMEELAAEIAGTRRRLGNRVLWQVNSTETGGGVAEMLQSVLCYLVGSGIDVRWAVVDGTSSSSS
jgi:trehalose synthase